MTNSKWNMIVTLLIVFVLSLAVYHQNTHETIWGIILKKKDLKDITIQTTKEPHIYIIKNKNKVLEIADYLSKMEKHIRISHNNYPPEEMPGKYTGIQIRTIDNTVYGGSFWIKGTNHVQDSNGFYWIYDYKGLIELLDEALPTAEAIN